LSRVLVVSLIKTVLCSKPTYYFASAKMGNIMYDTKKQQQQQTSSVG
jgi:hypothetical protein